jgi:hypothetical protein
LPCCCRRYLSRAGSLAGTVSAVASAQRAIDSAQERLDRYRNISAQGPMLQRRSMRCGKAQGRRSFSRIRLQILLVPSCRILFVPQSRTTAAGSPAQITTPRGDGRFRQIGVNLQLFATTANLQKILYTIETQQPYTC